MESLNPPVRFRDIAHPRRGMHALSGIIWAAIVNGHSFFEESQAIAQFLVTEDQQRDAVTAVRAMIADAFPPEGSLHDRPAEASTR